MATQCIKRHLEDMSVLQGEWRAPCHRCHSDDTSQTEGVIIHVLQHFIFKTCLAKLKESTRNMVSRPSKFTVLYNKSRTNNLRRWKQFR